MGLKKKYFYYDKEQFKENNSQKLFFLCNKCTLNGKTEIQIYQDINNDIFAFSSESKLLSPVFDSYKSIIKLYSKYYEISNIIPLGFQIKARTEIINLCIKFGYSSIAENSRPSMQNLAEIFRTDQSNILSINKRFEEKLKNDSSTNDKYILLMNFISLELINIGA